MYEAMQLRLNKRVAVKLMARDLAANREALARFDREAEITSHLGHPHLVNVVDFGQAESGELGCWSRLRSSSVHGIGLAAQLFNDLVRSSLLAKHAEDILPTRARGFLANHNLTALGNNSLHSPTISLQACASSCHQNSSPVHLPADHFARCCQHILHLTSEARAEPISPPC